MKNASLHDAEFLDRDALDRETTRVFEKCQDCRRCLPLCPSFPTLFDSMDAYDGEAARLTADERRRVIDLCYQCQLCYNHCPYHPPHEWAIDFPKLMNRAKLVQAREEGIPLPERLGQRQDLLGKSACLAAPLANAAFRNRAFRVLMEKGSGIDRRWKMPEYAARRLSKRLRRRTPGTGPNGRAVLFSTCFVEYSEPETGLAVVDVLEHNGVAVEPGYEACCGAPFQHGGDLAGARRHAEMLVRALAPRVREGRDIVVPGPTCSLQIKREVPELLDDDDARRVADHTYDTGEFLWKLRNQGTLRKEFPVRLGKVAYHLPCHLKAQNVGFRFLQILRAAGAEVEVLDHCSGVDGTWGMKSRWYDTSVKVAEKLVDGVKQADPDVVATDCPLSALRIEAATGRKPVHPIVLVRRAYGLDAKTEDTP